MDDIASLELGNDEYRAQKRLLTFLMPNKEYPIPKDEERKPHPAQKTNFIYKLFFWWLFPIMKVGYARTLQPNDLWILTDDLKVEHYTKLFYIYLEQIKLKSQKKHIEQKCISRNESVENSSVPPEEDLKDFVLSQWDIVRIIFLTFRRRLVIGIVLSVLALCFMAFTPLLTKYFIIYVEARTLGFESNAGKGVGYSIGLALMMFVSGMMINHFFYMGLLVGGSTKALLTNIILNKALKLNAQGRHKFPTGKITSMITTDLARIEIALIFQPLAIGLPVAAIIAIVILIINIGVAAVIGIVIFVFFLGFLSIGAKKLFDYRDVVSKITDKRVNLIKEILNNFKMIKFYSWESPYHKKVIQVRNQEIDVILKIQSLRNVIYSIAMTLNGISAMIAFLILYALKGKTASPANIFSSVSSFEMLSFFVFLIPQALSTSADMLMGFKRIGELLSAPEEEKYEYYINRSDEDKVAVKVANGYFSWENFEDDIDEDESDTEIDMTKLSRKEKKKAKKEKKERAERRKEMQKDKEEREKDLVKSGVKDDDAFKGLKDINLEIDKGEFVVITGLVGSGKSSLLNAISGFMKCDSGEIDINGSLLLCATSSVDYETDHKIQNTIASEFANCTILCIAHRLKTIINYDRILVMDKGRVSEFDSPWKLFNQSGTSLELGNDEYKPQKRLLTFLMPNKEYPIPKDEERKPHPAQNTNFVYKIFFWWLFPIMKVGYARTLQPNDLWLLTDDLKVESYTEIFHANLEQVKLKSQRKHILKKCKSRNETIENSSISPEEDLKDFVLSQWDIALVIFLTFKRRLVLGTSFAVLVLVIMAFTPLLTKYLIRYVEARTLGMENSTGKAIGYSLGLTLMMLVTGIMTNHFYYMGLLVGGSTKALLTNTILDKSLKLSARGRHKFPTGKITSMITTDLARIEIAVIYQPLAIGLPIAVVIAIIILIVNIGVAAVIGIVIFIFFLAFLSVGAKKLFQYRDFVSKITDKRVNLIKEILNNLKMIKFYSWEHPYHKKVIQVRNEEVNVILKIQSLRNFIYSIALTLNGISAMIAFLILYALRGKTSSPANIFSSVSSFEMLSFFVFLIPQALSTTADMLMGFKRIGELLSAPEEEKYEYYINHNDDDKVAVKVANGFFSWENFEDEINEDGSDNEVDMSKLSRKEKKKAKKEKKERAERRKEVQRDKEEREKDSNAENDDAFKGLKDINLEIDKGEFVVITGLVGSGKSSLLNAISGFMKCDSGEIDINGSLLLCGAPWIQNNTIRENITFGCEFDQEFYDQVIYACSLHIDLDNLPGGDFTEVGEKGITLSGGQKARINLARAVYANKSIILMDDVLSAVDSRVGKHIINQCLLGLLKEKTRILATHQLALIGQADRIIFVNSDGTVEIGTMTDLLDRNAEFNNLMTFSKAEEEDEEAEEQDDVEEVEVDNITVITDEKGMLAKSSKEEEVEVVQEEEDDHLAYNINKDPNKGKMITEEERAVNQIENEVYVNYIRYGAGKLGIWGFLILFTVVLSISTFCSIFTNTWLSFWVSQKFPGKSNGFYIGIYVMFNVLAPIFLTLTFIVLITMTTLSSKNMNLNAIDKILYTPMTFMDTTPMGRILNRFTKDTDVLDNEISENLRFFFVTAGQLVGTIVLFVVFIPWIACALPLVGFVFVLIANYYQASNREVKRLEAILRSFVFNNVNEVLSGVGVIKAYQCQDRFALLSDNLVNRANEATFIVYANQRWIAIQLELVASCLVLLVSLLCCFKVFNINAATVGLLMTYSLNIASSLSNLIRTFTEVENYMNSVERLFDLKYRPGLPLVLKNLNFKVKSHEKIGICGRTGAARKLDKSTRSENLPKFHLDKVVESEGENFSLGERQLVSFARALVRESKILILDEATSSVDYETDHKIQNTIASEFANCTILCIAHRLKTIINYDRILVMDKGRVSEFDSPWKLFNQPGSLFREMCDKSNITADDFNRD
ncbi:Oligomycin resistance ATP-dependent permease YOR1 [Spathaspora sp. JA1]|nr:Oligomycin resistance ATP-dependent permease YOR1 [Spathaspora sp. JA1]